MNILRTIGTILLAALMLCVLIISWYAFAIIALIVVFVILIKLGIKYYEVREEGESFQDTMNRQAYQEIKKIKEEGKLPDFKEHEEKFNNMFEELEKKFRPN